MLKLAVALGNQATNNAPMDPVIRGKRVRDLRLKRGLTQAKLSALAHVTENTIRGLERGTLQTRREKVEAVALALDTTIDLLERDDVPITEDHPLLVGLNEEDLRIAQAYSRARTVTRLRIERLLLTNEADPWITLAEQLQNLDERRRANVLQFLAHEHDAALRDELAKKKRTP